MRPFGGGLVRGEFCHRGEEQLQHLITSRAVVGEAALADPDVALAELAGTPG